MIPHRPRELFLSHTLYCPLHMQLCAYIYVCIIYDKSMANCPESITWSELGKQNIQPKKVAIKLVQVQ